MHIPERREACARRHLLLLSAPPPRWCPALSCSEAAWGLGRHGTAVTAVTCAPQEMPAGLHLAAGGNVFSCRAVQQTYHRHRNLLSHDSGGQRSSSRPPRGLLRPGLADGGLHAVVSVPASLLSSLLTRTSLVITNYLGSPHPQMPLCSGH